MIDSDRNVNFLHSFTPWNIFSTIFSILSSCPLKIFILSIISSFVSPFSLNTLARESNQATSYPIAPLQPMQAIPNPGHLALHPALVTGPRQGSPFSRRTHGYPLSLHSRQTG
ncbi:112aa long hypothetical protein [Pyrococcus horikoshii OT3]|uniref:Uncharacterized protein n=1 Tax=Pyrococcus horikoshii (strain ATCC 700860 / DSM 12428 / JCM 9974 / NBRC 100139 / OT-3) TaxID=70601 RepID=O59012_PYRHO|nr:112aa long hypothetical protein [Pyrococcus horikoshii OT3]